MLCVIERSVPADLKSQISDFKSLSECISRQLRGWANSLQNSEIPGQRHLNDQSRRAYENRHRREALLQRMDTFNEELRTRLEAQRRPGKPAIRPTNRWRRGFARRETAFRKQSVNFGLSNLRIQISDFEFET